MDKDSFNLLKIYHQNICGLKYKTDELISTVESNLPHVICLTEHHLYHNELNNTRISISHYKLGAQYCREKYSKGGTCIFLHETLEYDSINLKKLLSDLDIGACAITIHSMQSKICILSIYRAPSGNFSHFIKKKSK
jgi:exonuclease III